MTARFRSKSIADAARVAGVVFLLTGTAAAQNPPAPAEGGAASAGKTIAAPTAGSAAVKPTTLPAAAPVAATAAAGTSVPGEYVIGPEDVLSIVFWRDKDMSGEVAVRPDGMVSLPLLDDVQAAGLTPTQLRDRVVEASKRFITDPNVSVIVRQMNSRKVHITGEVEKPGAYVLTGPTAVVQLIALAGGLTEYAKKDKIVILRTVNGAPFSYAFNYKSVSQRINLKQNIQLQPGDTVVVP